MTDDWNTRINTRHLTKEEGGRDVLKKAFDFELAQQIRDSGYFPYYHPIAQNDGPEVQLNGKKIIMLGSNNYLGLTTHPEVKKAAKEAIDEFGSSLTGSRFVNGSCILHEKLEKALAQFLHKEDAVVFTTGYQANTGLLTALINKQSCAVIDKCAHGSIYDGCAMAKGETLTFQHNDAHDLDRVLASIPQDKGPLIMVDGVYSVEGDFAQLPQLIPIAKKHQARFVVDDAHGFGVMGPGGRGTAAHFGLEDDIDLLVVTFSKSLASIGGCIAGPAKVIDYIKIFGRSIIFSASCPPASTAAALKALEILQREPERGQTVKRHGEYMKKHLSQMGYALGNSDSPIIPIIVGEDFNTLIIWKELFDQGVYTNPFIFPAADKGRAVIRTSYMATHTQEHLDRALNIFSDLIKKYDFLKRQ